ncbi:MAG: translation initiation factor IF-3 [bacterium]
MTCISKELRINDKIRAREVRLIDGQGQQRGVVSLREALTLAEEEDLDLVEVSPTVVPPVCRLMDYGKFRYETAKKNREAKDKHKQYDIKEVKFRPKINEHDYQVKSRMVQRLLDEGDKVKVTMMFRGREVTYTRIAEKILDRVVLDAEAVAMVEKRPKLEGKNMTMILSPRADAPKTEPSSPPKAEPSGTSS